MTASRGSRRAASPPETLVWVYGIVEGRARPPLARVPRLPDGGGRPRALPIDTNLTAIVADVPAARFGAAALDARLADAEWVACCAAGHHAVIECLAHARTVVPFRVLTLFDNDERVTTALGPLRAALSAAIERVRGRGEWVVRVFRPARPAPAPVDASAPKSGTDFLRARHQLRLAEMARARVITESAAALARRLSEAADAVVLRPIDPGASAILDAAYLLQSGRAAAFRRSLSALSADLRAQGCRVTMTGPWPPYSFVDVGGDGHE